MEEVTITRKTAEDSIREAASFTVMVDKKDGAPEGSLLDMFLVGTFPVRIRWKDGTEEAAELAGRVAIEPRKTFLGFVGKKIDAAKVAEESDKWLGSLFSLLAAQYGRIAEAKRLHGREFESVEIVQAP